MSRALTLAGCLLLAAPASAQAIYDAGTTGNPAIAPSPTTQGWVEKVTGGCTVGDVSPDPDEPLNAWQLTDPGSGSVQYYAYVQGPSLGEWEAHLTMKPVAGILNVLIHAGPLVSDNIVDCTFQLIGSDVHVSGLAGGGPYVIPGAADGYHTYSIRSGYNWNNAEIRFDGTLVGTVGIFWYFGYSAEMWVSTSGPGPGRWRVHRMRLSSKSSCTQPPNTYCVASTTSLPGCQASMTWWGEPRLGTPDWFKLAAGPVPGGNLGICFFGASGAASVPFGTLGGQICVAPPTYRTAPRTTGGTAGMCNGYFAFTLQDLQNAAPIVTPGTTLFAEIWGRDPANPDSFLLSDGLRFAVCP